jgi:putative RecB family exonuclease
VQSYVDWRKRAPYEIWTTPDGDPAIELDVSGYLPGCPVEIKAYLDRVMYDPLFDRLIIVDLKTGKRPPSGPEQFGTYAALLKVKFDITAPLGVPFMNRRASLGTPFDLTQYTPEFAGEIFGEAWKRVMSGDFPPDETGKGCFLCDVSSSCAFKNGPLAHLYDPASPGYEHPPF